MRGVNVRKLLLVCSTATALSGAAGCSDDGDGAAGRCFDYSRFETAAPAVGFRTDVLPIFQRSCGVSGASCHGAESNTAGKTFLGPPLGAEVTDAQLVAIQSQNVGVASTIEPGMQRIAAGDPEKSFLMHKIDGKFSCDLLSCAPDCGDPMPRGGDPGGLPAGERDTIRRWIAQGARF
jgi:hypothetical protein